MDATTTVLRALADPTRRAVLEQLALGEATVSSLTARFPVTQPAISQHLRVLRQAGLVVDRHDGRFVYYRARPEGLGPMIAWVEQYEAFWRGRLAALATLLDEGMAHGEVGGDAE